MTTAIQNETRSTVTAGTANLDANAIEVEGLRREFPGGVVAVDSIDLEVRHGEIFGVLGPNGAGKSTTVRMLTTLLRPTAGRGTVGGFDIYREQR